MLNPYFEKHDHYFLYTISLRVWFYKICCLNISAVYFEVFKENDLQEDY